MSNSFLQQRLPTLLGIFAGMGLLIWALFSDERLLGLLFQPQGLALIIGGTLTACLVGFSWQELSSSFTHFLICFSGFDEPDLQDVYDTTVYLARQIREAESPEAGQRLLEDVRLRLPHPLLKEGLGLVVGGYTAAMIRETLETTLAQTSLQKSRQIRLWKFMGQMAPAFGLAGALLVILQAQGLLESSKIFPVLAAALVCLLYGVLFSGLIFFPIAEKLDAGRTEQIHYLQMCLESVILLQQRHHALYVESVLKPFLGEVEMPKPVKVTPPPIRKNSSFSNSMQQALAEESDLEQDEQDESQSGPPLPPGQTLSANQLRQFRPVQRRRDPQP
ncbi:MAG: motility protein A [Candidatus Sericytochromatia bacterium]